MPRCSAILFALPLAASASVWVVPGVISQSTAGPPASADLRVLNQGAAPTNATFDLLPTGGAAAPASVTQSIQPGQTLLLSNVLASLWNLTDSAGTVRITADQTLAITGRAMRTAAAGTLTTDLRPISYDDLLTTGHTGQAPWLAQSADPTQGYSTTAGVILALPQTSVDVIAYDPAGKELGRTNVTGGPAAQEIALTTLVPAGAPVGTVAFQVKAGRAGGYLSVIDNISGDVMQVNAFEPIDSTSAILAGLTHTTNPDGSVSQTDLRLFNPGSSPALFVFTLLASSGSGLAASASITVPAGQTQEIGDFLAAQFNAAGPVTAALRMNSSPAIVLARNVTLPAGQSSGGVSVLLPPDAVYLTAGQTGSALGVQAPPATTLGFLAGSDGATATLVLNGPDGTVLASAASAVSLQPGGWTEFTPDTAFAGVTFPPESTIAVQPASGEVYAYARTVDPTTNDGSLQAVGPFVPYSCVPPAITSFNAWPISLAAAGSVELFWSAGGADTIGITPGVGTVTANDSQTVNLTGTTTYTMTATGICGSTTQTLTVPIGVPTPQSVAPAAAQPGQQVVIHAGNAAPGSVTSVLFVFPDSTQMTVSVDASTPAGDLAVTVPLAGASTALGYETGPATIQIPVSVTAKAAPGVPFTIQPLTYQGDAVQEFSNLVTSTTSHAMDQLNQLAQLSSGAAFARAAVPMVAEYSGILQKMLSDMAATGSATIPVFPASAANPNPPQVTGARADLELILSLANNLQNRSSLTAQKLRTPRPRGSEACSYPSLYDLEGGIYKFCMPNLNLDPAIPTYLAQDGLSGRLGNISCASAFRQVAVNYEGWLGSTNTFFCFFQPVILDHFSASPMPSSYIAGGPASTPVQIFASLKQLYSDKDDLKNDIQNMFQQSTLPYVNAVASCTSQERQLDINQLTQDINMWIDTLVPTVVPQPSSGGLAFKCDLDSVVPQDNSAIVTGSPPDDDKSAYNFIGRRDTRSALKITTSDQNRVAWVRSGNRITGTTTNTGVFTAPVDVRGPHPTLFINAQAATFGSAVGISNLNTVMVNTDNPVTGNFNGGVGGLITYSARQLSNTAFLISLHGEAANNEPVGSTAVSLAGGVTFPVLSPTPIPANITTTVSGTALPFTDLTGKQALGQLSTQVYGSVQCAGQGTMSFNNNQNAGPPGQSNIMYGPTTVSCPGAIALSFSNMINGFIGGFTSDVITIIKLSQAGPSTPGVGFLRPQLRSLGEFALLPWRFTPRHPNH